MKFTINYSQYPYRAKQTLKWILLVFSLITAGVVYFTIVQVKLNRAEVLRYKTSIGRLNLEIEKQLSLDQGQQLLDLKKLDKKVKMANELILKKSFSWTEFLNDLEKAIPANISIKKIEPRFLDHSVNLSGESLTLKDLTRLILSLEEKPEFSNVFLLDQKVAKDNRIDFLIHLNYKENEKNEHTQKSPDL
ncbi:MAG: PilN domain-containing protein [Nitrospirae bacterium]|nr:PilN domain-containing protein [Nitrospirota bacterium]